MFLLKGTLNLRDVALRHLLRLGRKFIVLIRPSPKVEHLASLRAEWPKFIPVKLRLATAMWALYAHIECNYRRNVRQTATSVDQGRKNIQ